MAFQSAAVLPENELRSGLATVSLGISLCSGRSLSGSAALCRREHLLIPLWPRHSPLFVTVFCPHFPSLRSVSALSQGCFHGGAASLAERLSGRDVSAAELPGASCSRNGRVPHLFPQRPPRSLYPAPSAESLHHAANTNLKSFIPSSLGNKANIEN